MRDMKRFLFVGGMILLIFQAGCATDRYRRKSPEEYYEAAQKALHKNECYQAQLLFQHMLSDFPGSNLTDDAQFGLGQANQCQDDYITAIFEYERLLNEYPVSEFAPAARFQIGECYYQEARDIHHDQEETFKAIREYNRFIEDYPQSDLVKDAQARILELRDRLASKDVMIAQNYLKWGYVTSAQLYAKNVIDQFGDVEAAFAARVVIARVKVKKGEYEEALQDLTMLAGQELPPDIKKEVLDETEDVKKAMQKHQVGK